MASRLKKAGIGCGLLSAAGIWAVATFALLVWLNLPTNRLVHRWDQSADVKYGSFEPYTVYVLEGSRRWNVFGPADRRHDVWVAINTPGFPDHGHRCEYEFHYSMDDPDDYIRKCTVGWAPDGVTLTEPTGHRLFIPKSAFIGGR